MTTVSTADLWAAMDALDALPETHNTDWYKRLVEAVEAATATYLGHSMWVATGTRYLSMPSSAPRANQPQRLSSRECASSALQIPHSWPR